MRRMTLSSRFTLPGQVRAVATTDPSGPLTVTGYGANPLAIVITRVDLSGEVAWQRTYPGTGRPQSRMSTDGTLWVAYPDCGGRLLEGVLPDGSTGPTTRPECRPDEEIGAFVLLDDGFAISWVRASRLVRGERSRAHVCTGAPRGPVHARGRGPAAAPPRTRDSATRRAVRRCCPHGCSGSPEPVFKPTGNRALGGLVVGAGAIGVVGRRRADGGRAAQAVRQALLEAVGRHHHGGPRRGWPGPRRW